MKRKLLSILLAAAVVCTSLSSGLVTEAAPKAAGTTYYVSTIDGNDKNSGTSENQAFYSLEMINNIELQPGDQVLLECGSVFVNEALHVKGSGTEEAPILIGKYGTGNLPRIETNGQGIWYQNYGGQLDNASHKWYGYVSSAVLLYDVEYITVQDLEITNKAPKIETAYNATDVMNRTGVAAVVQNIGTADSIHLNNLYIHDVIGNVYDKHMNNGGIYMTAYQPKDEAATGVARYNDVLIENCYVENVNRWGIAVGYSYTHGQFGGTTISDATIAKYGSSNVVIRNNYIKEAGGDSITLMYCDRPIVEYNVSDGAARQINTTDYSATSFGRVAAGIWPWKCKDAVFQYNEAFDTYLNQDGQAWDADSGDGTIYQYNYSHNNGGGAVMFCYPESVNNIFRYNISQNDLSGVMNPCANPDAHVYNNTFYMKEGVTFIRPSMSGGAMVVENNIIYYSGDSAFNESWYRETTDAKVDYSNNLYYNYANTPAEDTAAVIVEKGTAVLENPGSAPTAPVAVTAGAITGSIVHERTAFAGYTPVKNSPAVDAGKEIADNGGQDFLGNTLAGITDIGAIESDAVAITLTSDVYTINRTTGVISGLGEGTSVADFLAAFESNAALKVMNGTQAVTSGNVSAGMTLAVTLDDVTITFEIVGHIADTNNELNTSIYMIKDQTIYVPATEKNPTAVSELMSGVTVGETATVEVRKADGTVVTSGNIEEGMQLVIIAESGAENAYTISVKNTYQWALDYAGPQQGNVWFGQNRLDETTYENLQNYDGTYPNWVVDTYYGPGVDLPDHSTPTDEDTHGLLSDNPSHSNAGMAMAFRAPKSGVITISVKDDEPYLRQNNNSGGSVLISFTKNGEVIDGATVTLTESKVQVPMEAKTVEVAKGDWIRVEAKNIDTPSRNSVHVTPIITYLDVAVEVECDHANTEVQNAKEATCTEAGYTGDTVCTVCGETVAEGTVIAAKGHNWSDWKVVEAATTEKAGKEERTCSVCGEKETKEIPKLEIEACKHTAAETVNAKEATCTEAGYTGDKKCKACGEIVETGKTIEALGHDFTGEWTVVKAPTYDEEGLEERQCSRCDAKEQQAIAKLEAPTVAPEISDEIVKVAKKSYNSVSLEWNAVAKAESYKVKVYKSDDTETLVAAYDKVEATNLTVSGLKEKTEYIFKIYAVNRIGESDNAIEVTAKTSAKPAAPSTSTETTSPSAPATGDSAQILTWIAAAFVMTVMIAAAEAKRRKN